MKIEANKNLGGNNKGNKFQIWLLEAHERYGVCAEFVT